MVKYIRRFMIYIRRREMDLNNLCMGCMKEKPSGFETCPYCGFNIIFYHQKIESEELSIIETNKKTALSGSNMVRELPQRPLPAGSKLDSNYIVGKKLGAGGFGVSYIGFDLNFERKVAIKEFYPRGYADRDATGLGLTPRLGKRGEYFLEQKEFFAHEGKVLAQVEEPGIVRVLSFIKANNTAYIVMEFLEGESLSDYVKKKGGYLSVAEALTIVKPVVKSLAHIHEKGLIHRDISPDNIMLTQNGPKVIDFGAALGKGEHPEGPPIGKKGYAPAEQLKRGCTVGSYSDVYSLCAMIYQIITGNKPPKSLDREVRDTIYPISAYQIPINSVQEAAIMQGLAMDYKKRIKNAGDLYYLLYVYGVDPNATVEGLNKQIEESSTDVIIKKMQAEHKRSQYKMKSLIVIGCIVVAGFLIIAVRTISRVIVNNNQKAPVVVSNTDDSYDELNTIRESMYNKFKKMSAENYGITLHVEATYEDAASDCIEVLVNANCKTKEEWQQMFTDSAVKAMTKHGLNLEGWVIKAYEPGMTVDDVYADLVASANADLVTCGSIGISVGTHADGTVFWMIIYK